MAERRYEDKLENWKWREKIGLATIEGEAKDRLIRVEREIRCVWMNNDGRGYVDKAKKRREAKERKMRIDSTGRWGKDKRKEKRGEGRKDQERYRWRCKENIHYEKTVDGDAKK